MIDSLIKYIAITERQWHDTLKKQITASFGNGITPLSLRLAQFYSWLRWLALSFAIRHGLWVADALNVTMALALRPGDIFFDIGANVGWMTEKAALSVGQRGQVHSFEPSPSAVLYLRRRIFCGRLRNVVINQFALGNEPGMAVLHEFAENFGGASSLRAGAWPGYQHMDETEVEVKTLDQYIEENKIGNIRLLKLDVQGAEIDVLRGGNNLLSSRRRPVLFVEVERDANAAFGRQVDDLLGAIAEWGYEMYSWRDEGLVSVRSESDILDGGHDDVICLHPEIDTHLSLHERLQELMGKRRALVSGGIFGLSKE